MTQYALPADDKVITNWAEGAGDADADHFDELDEGFGVGRGSGSGPDDATTYWVTTDEGTNLLRDGLISPDDPGVHTGHKYRTRNRKNSANGRQLNATITLFGPDEVASQLFTNIDNVWTTREDTLSEAEAGNITDYTDLEMQTRIIETGGGTPRIGWESAHEFECPDVAGGPAGVKTINDLAIGSIKTINDVAIALVKTINDAA